MWNRDLNCLLHLPQNDICSFFIYINVMNKQYIPIKLRGTYHQLRDRRMVDLCKRMRVKNNALLALIQWTILDSLKHYFGGL